MLFLMAYPKNILKLKYLLLLNATSNIQDLVFLCRKILTVFISVKMFK